MNVLAVGNFCYVAVCSAAGGASEPTRGRGEGRVHRVALPTYIVYINSVRGAIVFRANRRWGE